MDENGNVMKENSVDEFHQKDQDECSQTTILDLPRQVWLDIQNHLDYSAFYSLRQTCRYFQTLIDTYLGNTATFNNFEKRPDAFDFFTRVALSDVQFEDAADPEKYSFSKIICDPSCLTDVSFTDTTNLPLIQDILTKCCRLQMVEMTMTCKIIDPSLTTEQKGEEGDQCLRKSLLPGIDITSPFPPRVCHLHYVETLKLVPGIYQDKNLRSHLILSILRATRSGNHLKKVIFQCELDEDITLCMVLRITAEIMEKHPKLEALFLALLNDEYLLPEGEARDYAHYMDLGEGDHDEPEKVPREVTYFRDRIVATGQHLKLTKMGLAMLNWNMQLVWADFLKTQHHLVHLSLTVNIRDKTFSRELFDSFSGTLQQLAIRGKFEVPFDFGHISNCQNLKEICLHNLQENGGGGISPKCVNLPQVPVGLEGLILFQVVTRTEELQEALRKLDRLSTLVVFKCGHAAGETGVGFECLQDILHKRSLNSTLMVQFICGSTTEAEALAGVLYEMSQDVENQANTLNRLRRRLRQPNPQQNLEPDPVGEVENILHLPDVQGNNDEVLFAMQGDDQPIPARPVSRGNHRNPIVDESGEENDENNNSSNDPRVNEQEGAAEEFPPLPPPLQNPLNVLHNILEHVLVDNQNGDDNNDDQFNQEQVGHDNANVRFNHVHLNEMDEDVELIFDVGDQDFNGPMLDLFAAERLAREHNVQVGFILDGVIDIINEQAVRSKWLCVEDSNGQITYTLKISVEL